jgi:hypothetical protein
MAISNVIVQSTATDVFTSVGENAVTVMFFCNTSASLANVDIHLVPSTEAIGTGTYVIKNLSLPAEETYVFDAEKLILSNGDKIIATANVDNSVVATISSVQTG